MAESTIYVKYGDMPSQKSGGSSAPGAEFYNLGKSLDKTLGKFSDKITAFNRSAGQMSKSTARSAEATSTSLRSFSKDIKDATKSMAKDLPKALGKTLLEAHRATLGVSRQNAADLMKIKADHAKDIAKFQSDYATKNRILNATILSGTGAFYLMRSIGQTIGNSTSQLALGGALNRPDITVGQAHSQYYNLANNGITMLSTLAAVGTAMGVGAATGSTFGGPLGAILGALVGGTSSALGSYFMQTGNAGQQINEMKRYAQGTMPNMFGQYGMSTPGGRNFVSSLVGMPGGENTFDVSRALQGSVFGSQAYRAASVGAAYAAYFGGSPQQQVQVAGGIGEISKLGGMGSSGTMIYSAVMTLIAGQQRYGGDMVENLKTIADLMKSTSVGGFAQAARIAYRAQNLGGGFKNAAVNYLSQDPLNQFITRTILKTLTGVDINQVVGATGSITQQAGAGKRLQSFMTGKPGELNPMAFILGNLLGPGSYYGLRNAPFDNLGKARTPDPTLIGQINAAYTRAMNGDITGAAGVFDPTTQKLVQGRQTATSINDALQELVRPGTGSHSRQQIIIHNPNISIQGIQSSLVPVEAWLAAKHDHGGT